MSYGKYQVSIKKLENNLRNTIFGRHIKEIDNHLLNILNSDGENFAIPTLDFFLKDKEDIKAELLELYNDVMGKEDIKNIPDNIKIAQAALIDTLCFGYSFYGNRLQLITLNVGLFDIWANFDMRFSPQEILRYNRGDVSRDKILYDESLFKCFSVYVKYEESTKTLVTSPFYHIFSPKRSDELTCEIQNTQPFSLDNSTKAVIIPYLFVSRMMHIIENQINTKGVFLAKQVIDGEEKIKFITRDADLFHKYDKSFSVTFDICLESFCFPLKGYFYAPVLGSSGVLECFDFKELVQFSKLKSLSELENYSIVPWYIV
jgi:hypothetical protein